MLPHSKAPRLRQSHVLNPSYPGNPWFSFLTAPAAAGFVVTSSPNTTNLAYSSANDSDESNDEIRMSNDELMTKREMARGEQGAAVSSPPRRMTTAMANIDSRQRRCSLQPRATPPGFEMMRRHQR